MGARTLEAQRAVLSELCALVEAEEEVAMRRAGGLPNDGKRAGALLERTLEGGPHFWGDFGEAAKAHGEVLLAGVAQEAPTPGQVAVLKALVGPAISAQRQQTWADEDRFMVRTYSISPEEPAWEAREVLREHIKNTIRAGT